MADTKKKRLIYNGDANFAGNKILKISKSEDDDEGNAILISSDDFDKSIINNKNKFFVVSGKLINRKSSLLKKYPKANFFFASNDLSFLQSGDIIELRANGIQSKLLILFSFFSKDNTLVLTNACNNGCIMCPLPVAFSDMNDFSLARIKKIISLMPSTLNHLTISGGEPTLLKDKFIDVLSYCKNYLPNTTILVLTNGRMLSYKSFVDAIDSVSIRNLSFGIPIHSHLKEVHDKITGVKKSFEQTIDGILNLLHKNYNVELRVVINKKNYKDLNKISELVINRLSGVSRVSFMGMELLGRALQNKKDIWVEYKAIKNYLQKASVILLANGIKVNIFNIPICKVDDEYRSLCKQSISDYKVEYLEECESCQKKSECGGIFFSSLNEVRKEGVKPIIK